MAEVLWLDEVGEKERGRVGAKAYTLAFLRRQGLPVPDGFVLAGGDLEGRGRDALAAAYGRLGGAVAVRSSSESEDGEAASFAGQHLTVLDVTGTEAVLEAATACLASAGNGKAYAQALGTSGPAGMAVLVQRFVEPRSAGVAFTRHPLAPANLVIESHPGRGDALVSGRVSPDRYVVDRETRAVCEASREGGLGPQELSGIVALALRAEVLLGHPQDVEWAVGDDGLVLLQSRPITVEADTPLDPRVERLTRANVGEVLPDPVTPLTASTVVAFLEDGFRAVTAGLCPPDAAPFLIVYRSRLYLNLTLSVEVASRLPGVSVDAAERLVLGGGSTRSRRATFRPAEAARYAATALRILALDARLPRELRACEGVVAGLSGRAEVEAAGPRELAERLSGFVEAGRTLATTHVATSGACGVRLALLARLLAVFAPGDPMERLNRLMASLDDLDSARPAIEMEALGREAAQRPEWRSWLSQTPEEASVSLRSGHAPAGLAERMSRFLEHFGHRSVSEGELSASPWADDPRPVLAALQTLMASSGPPGFVRRARDETRFADEEALLSRLGPVRRAILRRALGQARLWVRRRERTKSLCIAAVHHGRIVARAAGARLVAAGVLPRPDDVFFLTFDELRAALEGEPPSLTVLKRRRRLHEREGALPAPREVDLKGRRQPGAGRSPGARDPVEIDGDSLHGVGVSAGVGRGPARVIVAGQPATIRTGEILVTPVLDAGLGPLLVSAAGAVAEMGGLLSHGSVVVRELGIPGAVDVRGATRRIRTGDLVEVDGGSGRVRIVKGADAGPPKPTFLEPADPEDERLHDLDGIPDHDGAPPRESVYFNIQDPARGLVLVSSMGARRGGGGESLVALGLPDGRVLFGVDLARSTNRPGEWSVAGQTFSWRPPALRIRARLSVHEAASFPPSPLPLLLSPRTVPVSIDLALVPQAPPVDFCQGLSEEALRALRPLGAHHVEQSGRWQGEVVVDGRAVGFEGTGSRDHSWGLRDWEAADHWRLFTACLDEMRVHALVVSVRGRLIEGGFVWRDGRAERLTRVAWSGRRTDGRLRSFDLEVATVAGERLRLQGSVLRTVTVPVQLERSPLRHFAGRPYRLLLHENFTRYTCDDRTGLGMAEVTERPLAAGAKAS